MALQLAALAPAAISGLANLGRMGLSRIGTGIAARWAANKTAETGLRSMNAARGVAPLTKGNIAMGAAGAANAGFSAGSAMNAAADGDVAGMAAGAIGMIPGVSLARNAGRAAKTFLGTAVPGGFVAEDLLNRAGVTAKDLLNRAGVTDALTPSATTPWVPTKQPAAAQEASAETTADTDPAAAAERERLRKIAEGRAEDDILRTAGIHGLGIRAGQNYQEITDDLRNLANQGPRQWDTGLRDMSEWEADTRRREIRMAYRDHPIPGKGEGKVLQFDNDLQKRREATENARINGFGQNVAAFDKSLSALGLANGQSVDMADKMFGQTAMRRGQDITREKNAIDGQVSMLSALGQMQGGGGAKSGSPYKEQKERLDYLKAVAETQYPDNPQGQKRLIDSVLLNSENAKAWDRFMQDGMPNVANELLTTMTDQTTYTPEQLGAATRSRFKFGDQLAGQWDDFNDPKDNTTWFEPRYSIPGRSDSVNERTLASLKGQSVTDLMKQAALNPTQRVAGTPYTYADFGGDEIAFQRAVMSYFQKTHDSARQGQVQ